MANPRRISKQQQAELLQEFCEALVTLKGPEEMAQFLIDLLTRSELIMLATRIQIAKFLLEGRKYEIIRENLGVGQGTIARVASWLADSGQGFRMVAERSKPIKKRQEKRFHERSEWERFKRSHPAMFWPEFLLEEIVKASNKRQEEKIRSAVEKLDHKTALYKQIDSVLGQKRKASRRKYG
ncbi:hypothetical protein KKI17_02955 [Patescibacteria group bacterium]|nr:hypothetical protein [Patescibacteria group bacterium]